MAGLFGNKTNAQSLSQRDVLQNKFNGARANLLLVVLFSAINLVMLVLNTGSYFLFSATVPYIIGDIAMDWCGKYPAEYYEAVYGGVPATEEMYGNGVFAVLFAIAAAVIVLYLVCWFLSKKPRVGFLIFALVLFAIDTVVLFTVYVIDASMILDYVFHAWVLISLISGISAYFKLKKLPPEEEAPVIEPDAPVADVPADNAQPEAADEPKATLNGEPIE